MTKFIPRDYQVEISKNGVEILIEHKILILSLAVRVGKTFISMMIANDMRADHVLFITKLKIIKSNTIHDDYKKLNPNFKLTITNYEQVHKLDKGDIDFIIIDESHSISKIGKPSLRAQRLKKLVGDTNLILMSGSITPESFSQIFPQLHISSNSPFNKYPNFYKWAHDFINIKKKKIAYNLSINDYSDANYDKIKPYIDPIMLSFTQEEAGFRSGITEHFLTVKMRDSTYALANMLIKDKVYKDLIVCDTPVSLQTKLLQIYSGTAILYDGTRKIFDTSKGEFIKKHFKGKKIGIYYKYKAELQLLKNVFGDKLTEDLVEFNTMEKNIALQIISGREGISLKKADALVMFNIDFAAVSYEQALHRMGAIDREKSDIYWIFSDKGIELKVYNMVTKKKNYTSAHFKKDFL